MKLSERPLKAVNSFFIASVFMKHRHLGSMGKHMLGGSFMELRHLQGRTIPCY